VRAARLRAIKADITERLTQDDLTVAAIASRQRISESYVRKLFESEGSSFSECVLGERLIRAHRMLTDPRFAGRSITSVAFDAGFGDASYFNRSFRRPLWRHAVRNSRRSQISKHKWDRTAVRVPDRATAGGRVIQEWCAVGERVPRHCAPRGRRYIRVTAPVRRATKIQYGLDCCNAK
jgi:AraC-like DNA-binding protein